MAGVPAQAVNGLEAAGGHQPGTGIVGQALARPLCQGGGEGLLQRFLGALEVTKQPDQGGKDTPRLGPVDRLHRAPQVAAPE